MNITSLHRRLIALEKRCTPASASHTFVLINAQELSSERVASIRPGDAVYIKRIVLIP